MLRGHVSLRYSLMAVLALLMATSAGCKIERLRHPDSSAATSDSETVPAATAATAASSSDPARAGAGATALDTARGDAAEDSATAPASPSDTSAVTATPAELRELAAHLVVPVAGLRPSDLHDTFAERRGGGTRPHEALDIPAPRGTPVLSATDGTLRKLHSSVPGGLLVYAADASDRFILMYGHLDRYADGLVEGQALKQGQVIGYVGTTGNAAADTPHLHFALARGHPSATWWRGTPVNPYPLLTGGSPASGAP